MTLFKDIEKVLTIAGFTRFVNLGHDYYYSKNSTLTSDNPFVVLRKHAGSVVVSNIFIDKGEGYNPIGLDELNKLLGINRTFKLI